MDADRNHVHPFAAGQAAPGVHLLTGATAPSFGLADYFFLGGFATLMGSLLLLPQSAQHSYERLRLILDMAAGVTALFVLLWVTTVGQLAAAGTCEDEGSRETVEPCPSNFALGTHCWAGTQRVVSEERVQPRVHATRGKRFYISQPERSLMPVREELGP